MKKKSTENLVVEDERDCDMLIIILLQSVFGKYSSALGNMINISSQMWRKKNRIDEKNTYTKHQRNSLHFNIFLNSHLLRFFLFFFVLLSFKQWSMV